jgi:hypothetical protein
MGLSCCLLDERSPCTAVLHNVGRARVTLVRIFRSAVELGIAVQFSLRLYVQVSLSVFEFVDR